MEDHDSLETREWLDALDSLVKYAGKNRAREILLQLAEHATDTGVPLPDLTPATKAQP